MSELLEFAEYYCTKGWRVFPLEGKEPRTKHGFKDALHEDYGQSSVSAWWSQWPDANVGLATGPASGVWVLDIDSPEAEQWLDNLQTEHGILPDTLECLTTEGRHLYWQWVEGIRNRASINGLKLDARGEGGYVVCPPSVHPVSGLIYEWSDPEASIEQAPRWLVDIVRREPKTPGRVEGGPPTPVTSNYVATVIRRECDELRNTAEGSRNDQLNVAAFAIGRLLVGDGERFREAAYDALESAALDAGLEPREIVKTIASGFESGAQRPDAGPDVVVDSVPKVVAMEPAPNRPEDPPTEVWPPDDGDLHCDEFTTPPGYLCTNPKPWYVLDALSAEAVADVVELFFTPEDEAKPLLRRWDQDWWWFYRAENLVRKIESELIEDEIWTISANSGTEEIPDDGVLKWPITHIYFKHKITGTLIKNIERAFRARPEVNVDGIRPPAWLKPADADGQPYPPLERALIMRNGTLDLKTGRLIPPTRDLFTLHAMPVAYTPEAPPPSEWLHFLSEVFPDEKDQIALQEWFGYLLVPDTSRQKILLLIGPPRSGKGTILRVLEGLLGRDSITSTDPASLASNFGLANLVGKLACIMPDARFDRMRPEDAGSLVNRMLSISGEDPVEIDRKYKDRLSMKLSTRLVIASNELPNLDTSNSALPRRYHPIRFTKSFLGKEDLELGGRLMAELPSILSWAIAGWQRIQTQDGFTGGEKSMEVIGDIEAENSPVAAFVADRCVIDPSEKVDCRDIWVAWERYREDFGVEKMTQQKFGRDLRKVVHGMGREQYREGNKRWRRYVGVGVSREWRY